MRDYGDDDYNEPNIAPAQAMAPMTASMGAPPAVAGNTSQLALQERLADSQMRYMMARNFPRRVEIVEHKLRLECGRFGTAQVAEYKLPVGKGTVGGVSIRLAETLAQSYGNMDVGREVVATGEDHVGPYSDLRVFALDLETGLRNHETIRVHHLRSYKDRATNEIRYQRISDLSELQRLFAQHAAKRVRQCILQTIPRDLIEKARAWCRDTLREGEKDANGKVRVPFADRVRSMVLEFERSGVAREKLEAYTGVKAELWTPDHFADLSRVFVSIRDGHSTADEWFGDANATEVGDTAARMRAQAAAKKAPAAPKEGGAQ